MPRIRTIKPEFPQSESMGRLTRDEQLLFILLWTIADDEGKARAASRMLASLLFPYHQDAGDLMERWLSSLEREDCIRRYQIEGSAYLQITNWLKHQKIDKPSKSRFPEFDETSRMVARPREDYRSDLGPRTMDLGPVPRIAEHGLAAAPRPALQATDLIEPAQRRTRKPQLPLPEDWKLSTELWNYGTSLGLTGVVIDKEETNIKLWCREKDHRCADRNAFVQRWLRRTADGSIQNGNPSDRHNAGAPARRPSRVSSALAGIASRVMQSNHNEVFEHTFEGADDDELRAPPRGA